MSRVSEVVAASGLALVQLEVAAGADRALVEVAKFGAHVTRWEEAAKAPFLFLSAKSKLDGTKAIRGGIPICWPQFGPLGPLKQHGFARDSVWTLAKSESGPDFAEAVFSLEPSEASLKLWPHEFSFQFRVRLTGAKNSKLLTEMSISNPGKEPFDFTCALHTYYTVGDISKTKVSDVSGLKYIDNLAARAVFDSKEAELLFDKETDRVYCATSNVLHIFDEVNSRKFVIEKSPNLPDAVIWNPWIKKAKEMADFGDEEYLGMVCVEAGAIASPVKVLPGDKFVASMQIHAE